MREYLEEIRRQNARRAEEREERREKALMALSVFATAMTIAIFVFYSI